MELCIEAELVEGDELYLDATKVDANASVHTLRTRFSIIATREHMEKVFAENPAPDEPAQTEAPASQATVDAAIWSRTA